MIESIMYFGIGFLLAVLSVFVVVPLIYGRAGNKRGKEEDEFGVISTPLALTPMATSERRTIRSRI